MIDEIYVCDNVLLFGEDVLEGGMIRSLIGSFVRSQEGLKAMAVDVLDNCQYHWRVH